MDSSDERLLRALFPPGEPFRHKMGLQRRTFRDFYAPTADAAAIRREKETILAVDPQRYTVSLEVGSAPFREFAELLGHPVGGRDGMTETVSLSLRIEPDFMLLMPPDWTLVWASVCFPSHWSLQDKIGRPLHEIHSVVPGLNAEAGRKIDAFFSRLLPGEGWSRANWGLSATDSRNQHPCLPIPRLTADSLPEETFVRAEDQHLVKLPETGAIAFGIRIFHYRLSELPREFGIESSLREKLSSMPSDVAEYKGLARFLAGKP